MGTLDLLLKQKYKYNSLDDGNYTIFIIPEPEYNFYYYPKYLPTYLGSTHKWERSVNFEISSKNLDLDLQLLSFPPEETAHQLEPQPTKAHLMPNILHQFM